MSIATQFRTDPRTGLQYHNGAEALIKANAVAGVVFLLLGGVLALLVSLTRWPAVHLLNAEWFYLTLTAHGLDMLIFWILFFEVAILYFCSSTLLRSRLATPRLGWLAFALMLIGAALRVPRRRLSDDGTGRYQRCRRRHRRRYLHPGHRVVDPVRQETG